MVRELTKIESENVQFWTLERPLERIVERTVERMLRTTPNTPTEVLSQVSQVEQRNEPLHKPKRFRCKNCETPVAFEVDVIQIEDIPSDTAQVNPHGFIHEVITVRHVQNTLLYGNPVPADSWFPGFCWKYLLCKECMEFLGWSYSRPNELTMVFAGLSKENILLP